MHGTWLRGPSMMMFTGHLTSDTFRLVNVDELEVIPKTSYRNNFILFSPKTDLYNKSSSPRAYSGTLNCNHSLKRAVSEQGTVCKHQFWKYFTDQGSLESHHHSVQNVYCKIPPWHRKRRQCNRWSPTNGYII